MKFDNFSVVDAKLRDCESAMSFLKIVDRVEVRKATPVSVQEATILKEILPVKKNLSGPFMYTSEEQDFMNSTFVSKDSINISFS